MEASALHAPSAAPPAIGRISISGPLLRLRSDEQLVALFRAGHEDAFRVIHDRYRQRLFAYVRQMLSGSRQDAEDAMQDVFLRAYRALRASERPITLRAWLYRVAHNRCIDELRRPVPPSLDVFEVSRAPLRDPLVEAERREDLRRLVADVRRLPRQQRSALLMRELQGLSYVELAEALQTTVPAVKSLLVRARMSLADAAESRDAACVEICRDLVVAFDRGVRMTGHVRRHMRDCHHCREFRSHLRDTRRSFAALVPAGAGPLGVLAGLGGSGAAASGGAATTGGAAAAGGGAIAATKLALVCCAALVTAGGALDLPKAIHGALTSPSAHSSEHARGVHSVWSRPDAGVDPRAPGGASSPPVVESPAPRVHGGVLSIRARRHFPVIDPDAALFAHRRFRAIGEASGGGTSGPPSPTSADGSSSAQSTTSAGNASVPGSSVSGSAVSLPGSGAPGSGSSSPGGPGPASGQTSGSGSSPGSTGTSSSSSGSGSGVGSATPASSVSPAPGTSGTG